VENERQQFPPPEPEGQKQQAYYGWQYEQDEQQKRDEYPVVPDMGSSLGYGQGMEYQYFDAPQPPQPIAQLRQDRLQQLREKRNQRSQPLYHTTLSPHQGRGSLLLGKKLKQFLTTLSASITQFQKTLRSPGEDTHSTASTVEDLPSHNAGSTTPPPSGSPPAFPRSTGQPLSSPPVSISPRLGLPTRPAGGGTTLSRIPIPPNSSGRGNDEVSGANKMNMSVGTLSVHPSQSPPNQSEVRLTPPVEQSLSDTGSMQRVRITRAALVLTTAFVTSRVLGLLRTSMFAFVFGTNNTSDAYLQAFLIPDLIFNIVAGGALTSAFIPVFAKYMTSEKDERTAWHVTSSALNLALVVMSGLALLVILFARSLVPLYNPGVTDPHQLDMIATLTRIMLLQSIILGAGAIVTSVLNARQNFRLPAIGTVLYNLGLIIGLLPGVLFVLVGSRNDQVAVYAATWGVVLGALFQVGIQIPGLVKAGMQYTPSFDWRHPGVRQIGRQMIPRIINAAMLYVSIFVDRGLIQLLVVVIGLVSIDGLITQYYQALQLVLLPLGIFGMSVSTAAFPTLAENVACQRYDRARSTILTTLRSILFLSIPSSVGLIVLSFPIIQVLLQHGHYTLREAQLTAVPLAFFAVGLTGLSAVEILTRSFYALRDSVTPVMVSVAQFVVKIALSLILINASIWGPEWGLGALALSTSIAGLLEAGVLFWLLQVRIGDLQRRRMSLFVIRILVAAVVMGVCLLAVRWLLDMIFITTSQQSLSFGGMLLAMLKLGIELFIGVFIYVRVARYLNIEELGPVKRVLDRLKLSWI
jgi:putative peptidoglycan lipid II flippase